MKKILMVLASEKFRDIEYLTPRAFFEQNNCKVFTSSTTRVSTGRFGYKVINDFLNTEINPNQFDCIFLVGGIGSLQYLEDQQLRSIFVSFINQNKIVSAICAAPRNFVAWGLATNKKITAHNGDGSFEQFAITNNAIPTPNEMVVQDGLMITGNGPEASEATTLKILENLGVI